MQLRVDCSSAILSYQQLQKRFTCGKNKCFYVCLPPPLVLEGHCLWAHQNIFQGIIKRGLTEWNQRLYLHRITATVITWVNSWQLRIQKNCEDASAALCNGIMAIRLLDERWHKLCLSSAYRSQFVSSVESFNYDQNDNFDKMTAVGFEPSQLTLGGLVDKRPIVDILNATSSASIIDHQHHQGEGNRRFQFMASTLAKQSSWTHWGLNPGPPACWAGVIPLHHVPHDIKARWALKLNTTIDSTKSSQGLMENCEPCCIEECVDSIRAEWAVSAKNYEGWPAGEQFHVTESNMQPPAAMMDHQYHRSSASSVISLTFHQHLHLSARSIINIIDRYHRFSSALLTIKEYVCLSNLLKGQSEPWTPPRIAIQNWSYAMNHKQLCSWLCYRYTWCRFGKSPSSSG